MHASRRSPASLFAVLLLALIPSVGAAQTSTVQRLGTPGLTAQPGQAVTLAMRFNAVPLAENYNVFIHFIDQGGVNRAPAGADHLPPVGTSQWSGAIAYNRTVTLPSSMPVGTYSIRVGLSQTHSPWDRVPLAMGSGVTVDDQLRYTVGTLTVSTQQPATTQVLQLATPNLSGQAGQSVTLGMRFNAVPMSQSHYVFVHLVDANGVQYPNLGADHLPPVSTTSWSGAIAYNRVVALPTNLASGTYTIRVGLYSMIAPSYPRVALEAGSGVTADSELRYIAGTLTVGGGQPTGNGPVGQDASAYVQTFAEEFNSGLNTSVWNDHIWYESSNPTINYAVRNGVLKIWPQRDASGSFFNRTLDTDGKFQQRYGYFEMQAKLPFGKGVWPAFWLFAHPGDRRPEIDIMEAYPGGGPDSGWGDSSLHPVAFAATVWPNGAGNGTAGTRTLQTPDLSAAFHVYGLKWEANRQTFYFDGQPFLTVNVSMGDPMYLLLDLWFGSASGTPDSSTPTGEGNSFEVNYVRAWQFR
ncbi:glycoside hydrolase family 16 protein [Corallococcus interemptor]|uniref:glycoside hydrolase family 16 protein n=1 Tax=Corallococcus interemptor TaxID=2316720 RepID=UPI003D066825